MLERIYVEEIERSAVHIYKHLPGTGLWGRDCLYSKLRGVRELIDNVGFHGGV